MERAKAIRSGQASVGGPQLDVQFYTAESVRLWSFALAERERSLRSTTSSESRDTVRIYGHRLWLRTYFVSSLT